MNMILQIARNKMQNFAFVMLCIVAGSVTSKTQAATIMKMTFGPNDTGNMQFQNGLFSALSDGVDSSVGDLDMSIDYMFCGSPQTLLASDPVGNSSVTLTGMLVAAPPVSNSSFIVQAFDGGSLAVFDDDNSLLLSANLSKSGLQGALGPGDKQGLFLGFGEVTGGLLDCLLEPDSLQLRIKFPKIENGFSLTQPPDRELIDFTTWTSSIELMATIVPEPSVSLLVWIAAGTFFGTRRRRRG